MKRRAAHSISQRPEECRAFIRIRVQDIYGGIIRGRDHADEGMAQLAASIARHGLLQPIVVYRNNQAGRYALVCGARRLAACRMIGMKEIDALCIEADEGSAMACFMEEHALSRMPCAMEEGRALARIEKSVLMSCTTLEHPVVEQRLRLLSLPLRVQEIACQYRLSVGQVQPLLSIGTEAQQIEAALMIAERGLTPAQAQRLVFGSGHQENMRSTRRRAIRAVLEEINALVFRLRKQGVHVNTSVHSLEGGLCIQLLFARGEKCKGQQDLDEKWRNS